jgi:ABC-type Na+ efflux pump permease subunit
VSNHTQSPPTQKGASKKKNKKQKQKQVSEKEKESERGNKSAIEDQKNWSKKTDRLSKPPLQPPTPQVFPFISFFFLSSFPLSLGFL